jgi:peptidoglycan/xylan/chitin deacetylase (PgdA/CDA1 family)
MKNIINHFSSSRGIGNLVLRVGSVLKRFGIGSRSFERKLKRYCATVGEFGCVPSLPITAKTLQRHPKLIHKLANDGVEFAVHGYIHIDHQPLSSEQQSQHFQEAIKVFNSLEIPFKGFRAPYLRVNDMTPEVLSNLGFLYDSSHVVHWDVIRQDEYTWQGRSEYRRLLEFYNSQSAQRRLALPRLDHGLVEIPVCMPDDEAMVDRFGIREASRISEIRRAMLNQIYDRGELFTIQIHPERIYFCESSLGDILMRARTLNPPVWVASMAEIAEWWKERDTFSLDINSEGHGRYRVKARCSEKATILLKNCKADVPVAEWSGGYQVTGARDFILESPTWPVIGVSPDSSSDAISFLKSEGFVVEPSDQSDKYSIYLDELADFEVTDEKRLIDRIEGSERPLVRYWRWPDQARSALTITGDIDSMTLVDFALRILENWWQNRKKVGE